MPGSATGEYLARVLRGEPVVPLCRGSTSEPDVVVRDRSRWRRRPSRDGYRKAVPDAVTPAPRLRQDEPHGWRTEPRVRLGAALRVDASENLRRHGLAVEAAVAWYGEHHFGVSGD